MAISLEKTQYHYRPHVLVADDDLAVCGMLCAALDDSYEITCATDAERAHAILDGSRVSFVLIDATISHGSAYELALHALQSNVPCLITTGHPEEMEMLNRAKVRFLAKPFRLVRLLSEMEDIIERGSAAVGELADALFRITRDRLLKIAMATTAAQKGTLQMLDSTGMLRIVSSHGFDNPFLDFFSMVGRADESACGGAFMLRNRVFVPDIEESVLFTGPSGQILRDAGVRAVQATPIFNCGRLIGMIATHRTGVWPSGAADFAALDRVVSASADKLGSSELNLHASA